MGPLHTLQLSIFAVLSVLAITRDASGCENSRFKFFGANKCGSQFSGFYNLYGQNRLDPNFTARSKKSNWIIETSATSNPERPTIFLATESINNKLSDTGPARPAKMLIRCLNNTTAVLFEFPGYEMSDDREYSEIEYHTSGESDDILELSIAGNKSVLGVWRGFRAIPFVRKLFDKQSLDILATAKNGTDLEASFNITGIETSITKLRNTCEW